MYQAKEALYEVQEGNFTKDGELQEGDFMKNRELQGDNLAKDRELRQPCTYTHQG